MSIVRHRIYGKADRPTIYYLTGYGGTLKRYAPHIRTFVAAGFRVVAFGYDKAVLNTGDPARLIEVLHELVKAINQDKKNHAVAGVYGASLGSWLGANVLVLCDLHAGLFNTGAGSIVRAVWDNPRFRAEKQAFQERGHTRKSLQRAWGAYEFPPESRRWRGKHALIMSSTGDKVIGIDEVRHNVRSWQNSGDDVRLIVTKRLGHGPVIVRNMFRARRTSAFFRSRRR
jgi:hypothetical protein